MAVVIAEQVGAMSSHWTESSSWFMQLSNRYKTVVFYCHRYFYSVYLMELILWYQQAVAIDCCCSILLKCTHNLWIIGSFYYRATTRTGGKLSRRSVQAIWNSCFYWFYFCTPQQLLLQSYSLDRAAADKGFALEIWNCCLQVKLKTWQGNDLDVSICEKLQYSFFHFN